jgi:hypothetical protein
MEWDLQFDAVCSGSKRYRGALSYELPIMVHQLTTAHAREYERLSKSTKDCSIQVHCGIMASWKDGNLGHGFAIENFCRFERGYVDPYEVQMQLATKDDS